MGGRPPGRLGRLSDSPAARAGDARPGSTALRWPAWKCDDWEGPATCRRWPSWAAPPSADRIRPPPRRRCRPALAAGVNHLDVAPQYGRAEQLLGPLHPGRTGTGLFVACKTLRHSPAGVRAQLEESLRILRCDSLRPLPAPRGHRPGRARGPGRSGRGHPGRPGRGAVPMGGHHRSQPRRTGRPPRGAAALRPRHGDVPGEPAAVVAMPSYRRDAEALLAHAAGARRGGDGHQVGGGPTLGGPPELDGDLVRALHRTRRGVPGHAVRPVHPGGARRLHARRHRGARHRAPGRSRADPHGRHRAGRGGGRRGRRAQHLPHAGA